MGRAGAAGGCCEGNEERKRRRARGREDVLLRLKAGVFAVLRLTGPPCGASGASWPFLFCSWPPRLWKALEQWSAQVDGSCLDKREL